MPLSVAKGRKVAIYLHILHILSNFAHEIYKKGSLKPSKGSGCKLLNEL